MSWEFSLHLLVLEMHYLLVHGTEPSADMRREYWQDMDEHNSDLCEQSSYNVHQENNMGNLKRSFQVPHEQVDNSYGKQNDDLKQNRKEIHKESRKQSKRSQRRNFKRRTMTKFINEWILFMFILHCLFAGALLDHIGTHWIIRIRRDDMYHSIPL